MTTQKTLKRRVRTRADRTGESYTSARAQVLRKAEPLPPDAMELTGMTDDALRRGSGKAIAEWLDILDAWGATGHTHTEIARWLVSEHGIGGWWAQSVTVGYERARGIRARHQVAGGYSVSVTRTMAVDAGRITNALTDASLRSEWLPDAPMRPRATTRGGSIRFDWNDPPSRIVVLLAAKGDGKTQVTLTHEKLPDASAVERMKPMWRERLGALREFLGK